MYIHINRPEAPEAAEWFELAARAVQVGNEKVARWRFRPKKRSKLGENWSVCDEKKTSKSAAPRGIDWTPLFGLKTNKNNEKLESAVGLAQSRSTPASLLCRSMQAARRVCQSRASRLSVARKFVGSRLQAVRKSLARRVRIAPQSDRKRTPGGSKIDPRGVQNRAKIARGAPRSAQERPGAPRERPRAPKSAPRAPQEPPLESSVGRAASFWTQRFERWRQ